MTLSPGSSELLANVPDVIPGVGVRVLGLDGGEIARFGEIDAGGVEHRCLLHDGEVVASARGDDAAAGALVASLLQLVEARERLESDMESMNASSLRLLEQVAMLTETLPRLATWRA